MAETKNNTFEGNISPVRLMLLITIVDHGKASSYVDLIQSFDCNIQITMAAHGTADREILEYLGLEGSDKAVIFSVVRDDKLDALTESIESRFKTVKNGKGVCAVIPFSSVIGTLVFGFLSNDRRIGKGA